MVEISDVQLIPVVVVGHVADADIVLGALFVPEAVGVAGGRVEHHHRPIRAGIAVNPRPGAGDHVLGIERFPLGLRPDPASAALVDRAPRHEVGRGCIEEMDRIRTAVVRAVVA